MKRIASVILALVMVFALTATVAAKDSPTGKDFYSITCGYSPADGSLGTASSDKNSVNIGASGEGGQVTLTAVTKGNGVFSKWAIDGDYEIVSGSLTDAVIVVKPSSDISAIAEFTKSGASPDTSSSKASSGNGSKDSPKTGDPLWIVLGLAVLALGAGALAVKKIKE